ncbi:transposase [Candidatus Enterovibrio escicola]|nr:transposase [Candidatus Enterovibrio escacola]
MLKLMPCTLVPLCYYLIYLQVKPTDISFVNSRKLQIYHNLRIP